MERFNGIIEKAPCHVSVELLQAMRTVCGVDSSIKALTCFGGHGAISAAHLFSRGKISVAFDGHIYNRASLETASSDAERVFRLYELHGMERALRQINGDFALAVHDGRDDSCYLARDRLGLKPLYYIAQSERLAFSSRLQALLKLPGVSPAVNRRYVGLFAGSHYRCFDNAPDQSPFEVIRQLPAAHFLTRKGGKTTTQPYWVLFDEADFAQTESDLAEQYRALLLDAVDVRVKRASLPAFTLSGGMDSSSVLACAVHAGGAKQHAFSTVYADKTYDESEEIRSMLEATVEKWHTVEIGNPDVFSLIEEMIGFHDEPVATATWLSHFLMCRQAAQQGFGSFFGGLGGDELNAGEYEHFFYFFADLRNAGQRQRYDEEVRMWARYHDHPIFKKSSAVAEAQLARVVDMSRPGICLPDRSRMDRYIQTLNRDYFDLGSFSPVMEHPFTSYLKNRTYQDMTRETVPCCLRAEDRQTAAFGMDNFLPFFDYRLVEFMFRVPSSLKYKSGVSKSLLREAMRGILPEETRTRVKKTGWNAPAHRWFSGPGRAQLLDLVHSQSFRERGIYNLSEVMRLLDEHEHIVANGLPVDNHMMFIWQMVNLEIWLRWVGRLPQA